MPKRDADFWSRTFGEAELLSQDEPGSFWNLVILLGNGYEKSDDVFNDPEHPFHAEMMEEYKKWTSKKNMKKIRRK